ncbi:glucose dehydrogenase precursor, putative [Pediculus humanus corporis]|uniref:Glucose dehydrogenase, putative n=1 Tax=Pediculus humanus subsp. corporis TaxID=121224 RepID=E0VUA4_PEDHC|nr:glucose dehydrogenase precursor, putative [Pediculus humanus corporis]EEB16960.1 glucose dehydrogenase precursor, putative [Pediculus humanus corporis]
MINNIFRYINFLNLFLILTANNLNLNLIFEKWIRLHKNYVFGTDESFYKQSPIEEEYDFIVIGSGPSGAAVANRLSEISDWNVLLVEAGKEPTLVLDIPMLASIGVLSEYNWGFKAEREEGVCMGMEEGRCRWPKGKCLGGTSVINYMIYTRGNKEDFDEWARDGNEGWGYKDVWPYFVKSEKSRIPHFRHSVSHGQEGPVTVDFLPYQTKLIDAFLQAGQEMGYKLIDYNDGTPPLGFAKVQGTVENGRRFSAERAYLRPIKYRSNLQITLKTLATKLLIDPITKRTYGVEMVKNGKTHRVLAKKEVILSAGALQSPQLLMLSGIGPKSDLESLNITVLQNSEGVGKNLQEHICYSGLTFLINQTNVGVSTNSLFNFNNFIEFFERGKGVLTLLGGVEGLGYISTKLNDDQRGRPDIEFIFASASIPNDNGLLLRKGIGITDEIYEKTYKPLENRETWTVWPMLLHPKSKGYLKLKSNSPYDWPKFYANYFQDEHDLNTLVEGVKMVVNMSQTKAFQKYGSFLNPFPVSGCEEFNLNSDEYWKCAVKSLLTTLHHQSGTCKMGPPSDTTAVVSPELKVYGIKNLRVVDTSIIPKLVTAHTMAAAYMIGEKASDMIKQSWLNNT